MASLFSAPKPPPIIQPKAMPVPDDKALQQAKMQEIAAASARSGRSSTILTDQSDKLGA